MTRPPLLGAALCALVLTRCVAPAPDDPAYESNAVLTAQAALSAARTALLSTRTAADDRLPETADPSSPRCLRWPMANGGRLQEGPAGVTDP
jgi:hypothetical protein